MIEKTLLKTKTFTINKNMKNQQPEETTYQTAWTELQKIVNDLQGGSVGIDELTNKIERAAELVRFCRERLRSTEDAVGRLGQ